MSKATEAHNAETLYKEGMKYNWSQDKTPAGATLARANLERAAALGHPRAIRALADMMFAGSGGPKEQEHALWLKWQAFSCGDQESLEDLSAMLDSYSENEALHKNIRKMAYEAAGKTDEAIERLESVGRFLRELVRDKFPGDQEGG